MLFEQAHMHGSNRDSNLSSYSVWKLLQKRQHCLLHNVHECRSGMVSYAKASDLTIQMTHT